MFNAEQQAVGHHLRPGDGARVIQPMRRRKAWRGLRVPFWFVIPALAAYAFVTLWPSLRGTVYAFTDWDGISSTFEFVGLRNFAKIFTDPLALAALGNTLALAAAIMILQNVFGLMLALALNSAVKSRTILRVIFFAPVVLTPLVAGYIWSYLLSPDGGINSLLGAIGLSSLRQDWLGDPHFALASICVAILWQFSGYSMVIYLAGLKGVPEEIIEAAVVDGARPVRRFFSIVLPLINGAIVINLLLTLIGGLGQFDQVFAMTQGGPGNATQTISTVIYKNGFQLGDYPYATALAVVMAIVVGGLALLQYRLTSRQVER
jgi:raffinose/stachyose/melibiose transport system permease protein